MTVDDQALGAVKFQTKLARDRTISISDYLPTEHLRQCASFAGDASAASRDRVSLVKVVNEDFQLGLKKRWLVQNGKVCCRLQQHPG